MKKWMIKNKKADLEKISEKYNIEKLIARILVNRELDENEIDSFINPDIENLYDPLLMKDMSLSIDLIVDSIENNQKIRIVGDYDQDGISSTVVLMKAFKILEENIGKRIEIDYEIPDRVIDGYGINNRIVEKAYSDNVDLIITCDNGISAVDPVSKAKDLGIKVIITDHHDVPEKLPDADTIVNPKRMDCEYPFDLICGATVAFKLVQSLFMRLLNSEEALNKLYNLLQFVAMATVCDVVDLIDENRIIVKKGLEIINSTDNIGLLSLIKESGIENKEIGAYHLGFVLGPCINATGRLGDVNSAIEMFLTDDESIASDRAKLLVSLNDKRKEMTENAIEQTTQIIENNNIAEDDIIVVYNPEIHESIAGIVAGRIKEKYYKPTFVLTKSKNLGIAKGSGRSIEEYDMFRELTKCKELLLQFGGHPMAAGLNLAEENIELLKNSLNKNSILTKDDLIEKIYIDAHLPIEGINILLPDRLQLLEPFGKGNRKPAFGDKDVKVSRIMILGKNYKIIKMNLVKNNNRLCEAIYFGDIEQFTDYLNNKFGEEQLERAFNGLVNDISLDLIYYPSINEYMGNRNLQIVISDYR